MPKKENAEPKIAKSVSLVEENNSWVGDKLGRKEEGEWLSRYLINLYNSEGSTPANHYVLNVNAEWGFGKTYFLKNLQIDLQKRGHQTVYFDAWKNDFSDKPMLGFITEINDSLIDFLDQDEALNHDTKDKIKKGLTIFKKAAGPLIIGFLAKRIVGASLEQILEQLDDDDPGAQSQTAEEDSIISEVSQKVSSIATKSAELALAEHKNTKISIETFKNELGKLVQNLKNEAKKKLPLFILVDELDRCRPTYAIELLETIKHLFEVDGVYFVIATASRQLSHSINAVYGDDFESQRYLNRFFDHEYVLAEPRLLEYCDFLWNSNISDNEDFISGYNNVHYDEKIPNFLANVILLKKHAEYANAGLRDIEQATKLLQAISLTYKEIKFSNILFFIVLCKIRHPEIYGEIKKNSNTNFIAHTVVKNYLVNHYNLHVTLTIKVNSNDHRGPIAEKKSVSLSNVIADTLNLRDNNYNDLVRLSHQDSIKGSVATAIVDEMKKKGKTHPKSKILFPNYVAIVDQVGRLIN